MQLEVTIRKLTYIKAKATKLNFKSKSDRRSKHGKDEGDKDKSSRRHYHDTDEDEEKESTPSRRHHKSRRRHERKHRRAHDDAHTTSTRDGEYYDPDHRHRESILDDIDDPDANSPGLGAEHAFRESLHDALANDEGAAYWADVYGQPIHVYPDTKPGPEGKLERMTEEEYADYVRRKMWEKTHQHIIEERKAEEKARKKRSEEQARLNEDMAREERDRKRMRQQVEESLKRGAERKKAKEAGAAWDDYTKKWEELKSAHNIAQDAHPRVSNLIPWPVASGKAKHVSKEEIKRFLQNSSAWKKGPAAMLKIERVRWHPDKMQQRFGQHIDSDTMKSVTAVFQVIDDLWSEQR
jgi:hypothetical protein